MLTINLSIVIDKSKERPQKLGKVIIFYLGVYKER